MYIYIWILYVCLCAVELKLVGYGNSTLGIEVQVLSSSQNSKLQLNQQTYSKTITGLYLSLHCGQKYYALNCGSLTTVDTGNIGSLTVVIVPMENGVLLTGMAYDNKTNVLQLSVEHVVDVPLCQTPLAIVQTENMPRVWMVCINGDTVYLFRMTVDLTILTNSNMAGPLAQYALSNVPTHLSNVIVTTAWEEDSLIFATDDTILQVSVEEQVISKISYGLCSYITLLQNAGNILHVYCIDNSIQYLNTDGELITSVPPPPAPALLLPCKNVSSVYLLLFVEASYPYLTYKIPGANLTGSVDLDQWVADLDSWLCFGDDDMIHFAFTDNLHGAVVITIYLRTDCTGNNCIDVRVLDSTSCANKCKPLVFLNERWLVLETVANAGGSLFRVFDSFSNFSTIIEANHIHVNFYTLLEYSHLSNHDISASTTVPFSSFLTEPTEVPTKYKTSSKVALYVTVSMVVMAFSVLVIGSIIFCLVSNHRSQQNR